MATASRPMPFENKLAKMALHARLQKEMPKTVPIEANEANYLAGAREYLTNCAVCHGVPGKEKTAIARGEFPQPPELFPGKGKTAIARGEYPVPPELFQGTGVTDDPPGETYWKVANGIRLTGMPGFSASLSPTEMWQISLLLANADKLPPSVSAALVAGQPETPASVPTTAHPTPTR